MNTGIYKLTRYMHAFNTITKRGKSQQRVIAQQAAPDLRIDLYRP